MLSCSSVWAELDACAAGSNCGTTPVVWSAVSHWLQLHRVCWWSIHLHRSVTHTRTHTHAHTHTHTHARTHTHTHAHTHARTHPFNGHFSGATRVSRYQKGKTNLNFTEARDSEWHWHQLGHIQVCTALQTDNHTSTPPFCFLQAGCPSCRPTNSVKALKAEHQTV